MLSSKSSMPADSYCKAVHEAMGSNVLFHTVSYFKKIGHLNGISLVTCMQVTVASDILLAVPYAIKSIEPPVYKINQFLTLV